MKTYRLGIMGAGNRGIHGFGAIIGYRDNIELVALADTNPRRMQGANEVLGIQPAHYSDMESLVRGTEIDALIITTPDYLHADHVVQAIQLGVPNILIDKPLSATTAQCLKIVAAMKHYSGKIMVGFNLRHVPVVTKMKAMLEAGDIGDLMLIENREFYDGGRTYLARWNRRQEWSGGIWVHKGSHDFDAYNWWNKDGNPTRVSCFSGVNALRADKIPFAVDPKVPVGPNCARCAYLDVCPDKMVADSPLHNVRNAEVDGYYADLCVYTSDSDVHDNGIAIVDYDNNVRASHMQCYVCGFSGRFYTLIGDRGIICANTEEPVIHYTPRWGKTQMLDVPQPDHLEFHGGADPLIFDRFMEVVRGENDPDSTVRDGLRSVVLGEAAEISWREKRMVELDELVNLYAPELEPAGSPVGLPG